jgi:hypothetical protein
MEEVRAEVMNEKKLHRFIHLSWVLKAFLNKYKLLVFCLILGSNLQAQNDSLPYKIFKDKFVLHGDIGFSAAPFSIQYPFSGDIDKLKYRDNFRPVVGLGFCYKWLALRLAFSLPTNFRAVSRYGSTKQFNLGFDFTVKKTFIDVDLRSYFGYAIKNAKVWNDTLSDLNPNDIRPNTNAVSFSMNAWYFHDKNFKMSALRGKTAHYTKEVQTWYLKNIFNIFGVGISAGTNNVIPDELQDSTATKTGASVFSAVEFGVVPGYAYVNKIRNWQFSGLLGLGAVIQSKYYNTDGNVRGFLGLAPRYDIRLIGGYSVDRYFVMLITDFDNKSIRFTDLEYQQYFYSVRLSTGIRLNLKKDKESKKL